jgi:Skp family chaperone for outer membrane proteins
MKHLILTLSLILGLAMAASAEITAGEILGTGKVINQFDQPTK